MIDGLGGSWLADLPTILIALLVLAAGVALYALPQHPFRALGVLALAAGCALATARHLGLAAAAVVMAIGVIVAAPHIRPRATEIDSIGLPLRLLLLAVGLSATIALASGRALGLPGGFDANIAWYWCAMLGALLLLSEHGGDGPALGAALLIGATGLIGAHLLASPTPQWVVAVALATLLMPLLSRARGSRHIVARDRRPRRAMVGLLVLVALALAAGASVAPLALPGSGIGLDPIGRSMASMLLLIAVAVGAHVAIVDEPALVETTTRLFAGVTLVLTGLSMHADLGALAIMVGLVPLVLVDVRAPTADRPDADGALFAIVALAVAFGSLLPVAAQYLELTHEPAVARIALAGVLLHVSLVSGFGPGQLWVLGQSIDERRHLLAGVLGVGAIGSLGVLLTALGVLPFLTAIVGSRDLLLAFGLAVLGLGVVTCLGETRPRRLAVQVAAVTAGLSILALSAESPDASFAAALGLAARALALATALLAAAEIELAVPRRAGRRETLLGGTRLPYWIAVATLAGLPPTVGFAVAWTQLAALTTSRPRVALAVLVAIALVALASRRVATAMAIARYQSEPDQIVTVPPEASTVRRIATVPHALAALLVLGGAASIDPVGLIAPVRDLLGLLGGSPLGG